MVLEFGKTDKAKSVMPNKVVDALSFGLPVISGESSGLSEFISSHENGIISKMDENDLSNKINNFFDLPENKKEIGMNGFKTYIDNFKCIYCQA